MDSKLYYNYCCIYKYDLGAGGGVAAARHRVGVLAKGRAGSGEGKVGGKERPNRREGGIAQLRTVSCLLVT